jgi:uncharacterized repeat protein (TIGR01451 family)
MTRIPRRNHLQTVESNAMKHYRKIAVLLGTAAFVLNPQAAFAEGTSAGTTITNTATVDFRVGGVDQIEAIGSDSFLVDRKVNVLVAELGSATTTVSPGSEQEVTTFTVTNLSNDTIDLALSVAQLVSNDFNVTNVSIYLDDGNGSFDGADSEVTFLDEVPEDETLTVFVVSDIPLGLSTGDLAEVVLTAQAHAAGAASALGAELEATSGPDTSAVDTVLADGQGETDSEYDGAFSAKDSYTAFAASLTVTKTSVVISDPVNDTTDPKAIPGAVIGYCVAVGNAAGSATASNVIVTDVLPGDVTYDATFGIFVDGTIDGSGTCLSDGVAGGSFAAGEVTGSLSDIAADETRTLYFRATIN